MRRLNYKTAHTEIQDDNSFTVDGRLAVLNKANKKVEYKQEPDEIKDD